MPLMRAKVLPSPGSQVPTIRISLSLHPTHSLPRSLQLLPPARHPPSLCRSFTTTRPYKTDGVFRDLTAMRVPTPWIDALTAKREGRSIEDPDGLGSVAKHAQHGSSIDNAPKPKKMQDSYVKVVLPLARDRSLADGYLNSEGSVRLGALFMDLDALSGVIAYRHTGPHVTTVTASFDRISLASPLDELCDLELSGQVMHVGKSSMEIALQVAKLHEDGSTGQILLSCACTMVSLDPVTKKPTAISPLLIETSREKELHDEAERNSRARKELRNKSLRKHTPDAEESKVIHALWQKQLTWHDRTTPEHKPANVHWLDETKLHTAAIMQPQYRNRHHFMIFGGFLLRGSYELAFCCAASFARARPRFVSLDPSTFETPVPVGSVLYLTATVVYTDPEADTSAAAAAQGTEQGSKTRVLVRVDSYVRNIEHGERKSTGTFNYSFEVDGDARVMPRTYGEFMMYIDAKRRARSVADVDCQKISLME